MSKGSIHGQMLHSFSVAYTTQAGIIAVLKVRQSASFVFDPYLGIFYRIHYLKIIMGCKSGNNQVPCVCSRFGVFIFINLLFMLLITAMSLNRTESGAFIEYLATILDIHPLVVESSGSFVIKYAVLNYFFFPNRWEE